MPFCELNFCLNIQAGVLEKKSNASLLIGIVLKIQLKVMLFFQKPIRTFLKKCVFVQHTFYQLLIIAHLLSCLVTKQQ